MPATETSTLFLDKQNLKTVSFGIALTVGAASENIKGLTNVVYKHLLRQTINKSEDELAEYLDKYGLSPFGSADRTTFYVGMLSPPRNLEYAIAIFKEMLLDPQFQSDIVQRIVQQQIAQIQQVKSQPESTLSNYTRWHAAFNEDPITKHPLGSEEDLVMISEEDLATWFDNIKDFKPSFVMVGKDVKEKLFDQYSIQNLLDGFGDKEQNDTFTSETNKMYNFAFDRPQMASSNSYIGVNLRLPEASEMEMEASIFNALLSGGVSSRLFTEIRENNNLSYSPRSYINRFVGGGLLTAMMDVRPETVEQALEITLNLLNETLHEKLPKEEIDRALKNSQKTAVFVADSSSSYTGFTLSRLVQGREHDLQVIKEKLRVTSEEDWQETMLHYWKSNNISGAATGENDNFREIWLKKIEEVF